MVQDPAQARVLAFAAFPPGAVIWDACAGPGGKTAALSRDHRVIASDVQGERVSPIRETMNRAATTIPLFVADAEKPPVREKSLDAVLLDAPCSATGTFARHPDARWRLTPRRIASLAKVQGRLLDGVAPVVRPGGLLVYATCSLEPEENAEQVNQFLARHPEYQRSTEDLAVFPGEKASDGAYAARLVRTSAA